MEQLSFTYVGKESIRHLVQVGHVGSGDLEVLLEPTSQLQVEVQITTAVEHRSTVWQAILDRQFGPTLPAMKVTIADFGATPGVINLRLIQALGQLNGANGIAKDVPNKAFDSFVELDARERAWAILDKGSARELLGRDTHLLSPWLPPQGIVPQTDDGCVVAKGTLTGMPTVVIGIDGVFQGGAIGEISGAKVAAALELALDDASNGSPTQVVLLLETGGVRLQEANLGLAAIAEIHAAIVALRRYVPVTGVIAGSVGCFGGMSIAAALCSKLIVTQEARLGLNGPQVIEQEAGIAEYDSRNRQFIWQMTGGEQRYYTEMVDVLVDDDVQTIRQTVKNCIEQRIPPIVRCEQIDDYLAILDSIDSEAQASAKSARQYFSRGADL